MHWIQFFAGVFIGVIAGFLLSIFFIGVGTEDREYERAVRRHAREDDEARG